MKNRYWFLSIILLLLICVYFFNYSYTVEKERKIGEIVEHQKIHAKQAGKNFNAQFEKWKDILIHLSDDENLIEMNQKGKNELKALTELFGEEIDGITRTNSKGIIKYTYPDNPGLIGADISFQKHMIKILKDHKPIISDVFRTVQGHKGIAMHVPIFVDGEFNGTIAFLLNFEKTTREILDDINLGKSSYAWMISEDGIELYGPDSEQVGKPVSETVKIFPGLKKIFERMLEGKEGVVEYSFYYYKSKNKPVEKIAYYLPIRIENTFWSLAVTYSLDEITGSLSNFRNKLLLIFALLFVGGVLLSYFSLKALIVLKETDARLVAENLLKESEKKYRLISSVASDYMFSSKVKEDGNLMLEWVSGAFEKITGYTFEEYIIAGGWRGTLHPEDVEHDNRDMNKLRKNQPIITEIRTIAKDESIVWVRVYAQPVWDEKKNKLTGIYGAVQDITEKKQADELVKILSRVVEQSKLEIILTDLDGNIEYANKRVSEITGYKITELHGQNPRIFQSGDMSKEFYKKMWDTVLSGSDWSGEFLNKKKSGELYWESAHISSLKNEKGEISHLIGVKEDITEKKKLLVELVKAKDDAEKSDKLKTEFLAQMSHEIRTPINSILSFSSLLESEVYDSVEEDLKQSFSLIESAGRRIIRTIDMILSMSEIVTETYDLHPRKISLSKNIIQPIIPEYIQKAKSKNISINLKINCNKDDIVADEYTVSQIFHNLIDNAVKYTEKGRVEINVYKKGNNNIVEIIDSGIGISKEYINNIFDPFTQEQQGYTRKYEGNGLGLALVKKYCELNNAEIKIESEKGKGSKFTIIFEC